jgi:hypothetical protein
MPVPFAVQFRAWGQIHTAARQIYRALPHVFCRQRAVEQTLALRVEITQQSGPKRMCPVILSCAVVLVPFSNLVPKLTGWAVRDRVHSLYRRLRLVEAKMQTDLTASQLDALQSELESIDQSANNSGVPTRHSNLFFDLKIHINHVRQRLGLRRAALHSEIREVS